MSTVNIAELNKDITERAADWAAECREYGDNGSCFVKNTGFMCPRNRSGILCSKVTAEDWLPELGAEPVDKK